MGRPRKHVKLPIEVLSKLQIYTNLDATISLLNKRYVQPEISEYIESQEDLARRIVSWLAEELKIDGIPDIQAVDAEYDYYKDIDRLRSQE